MGRSVSAFGVLVTFYSSSGLVGGTVFLGGPPAEAPGAPGRPGQTGNGSPGSTGVVDALWAQSFLQGSPSSPLPNGKLNLAYTGRNLQVSRATGYAQGARMVEVSTLGGPVVAQVPLTADMSFADFAAQARQQTAAAGVRWRGFSAQPKHFIHGESTTDGVRGTDQNLSWFETTRNALLNDPASPALPASVTVLLEPTSAALVEACRAGLVPSGTEFGQGSFDSYKPAGSSWYEDSYDTRRRFSYTNPLYDHSGNKFRGHTQFGYDVIILKENGIKRRVHRADDLAQEGRFRLVSPDEFRTTAEVAEEARQADEARQAEVEARQVEAARQAAEEAPLETIFEAAEAEAASEAEEAAEAEAAKEEAAEAEAAEAEAAEAEAAVAAAAAQAAVAKAAAEKLCQAAQNAQEQANVLRELAKEMPAMQKAADEIQAVAAQLLEKAAAAQQAAEECGANL